MLFILFYFDYFRPKTLHKPIEIKFDKLSAAYESVSPPHSTHDISISTIGLHGKRFVLNLLHDKLPKVAKVVDSEVQAVEKMDYNSPELEAEPTVSKSDPLRH